MNTTNIVEQATHARRNTALPSVYTRVLSRTDDAVTFQTTASHDPLFVYGETDTIDAWVFDSLFRPLTETRLTLFSRIQIHA